MLKMYPAMKKFEITILELKLFLILPILNWNLFNFTLTKDFCMLKIFIKHAKVCRMQSGISFTLGEYESNTDELAQNV